MELFIRASSRDSEFFKAMKEGNSRVTPKWLTVDAENLTATVSALPTREEIDLNLQENLIVEFYSR